MLARERERGQREAACQHLCAPRRGSTSSSPSLPPRREAERSWRGRSNGMLGPGLGSASPTTSTRPQARFRHTQTPAAAADLEALHSSCRHSNQYQRVAAGGHCSVQDQRMAVHTSVASSLNLGPTGEQATCRGPPSPEARSQKQTHFHPCHTAIVPPPHLSSLLLYSATPPATSMSCTSLPLLAIRGRTPLAAGHWLAGLAERTAVQHRVWFGDS